MSMPEPTVLVAITFGLASVALLLGALLALRQRHAVAGATTFLLGMLLLSLSAVFATVTVAVRGYRALTMEEVALVVRTRPVGEQIFVAHVVFPDGRREAFALEGDQVYVDARILKWHGWANLLGLHTAYELDRIAGRYVRIEDERTRPRSLFSLAAERSVDVFELRLRHAWLAPLLDARYGSATFIAADRPATYEIRVSTTGLLAREVSDG